MSSSVTENLELNHSGPIRARSRIQCLEFIAGCAVDADIYYLAAALGPGHEYYDPDPRPTHPHVRLWPHPQRGWFYHDLQDFQVMSTELVPEEEGGRPRRVLALDFYGQLEDYSRAGATIEYVSAEGADFPEVLPVCDCWATPFFCAGPRGQIYHRGDGGWRQLPTQFATAFCEEDEDESDLDDFVSCSKISATCSNWAMLPHFLEIRWNATQSFAGDSPIGEPT